MARKTAQDSAAALDKALRGLFRTLERRPVPGRIASFIDQLEETEQRLKKSG